jgi:hypothetical protein
VRSTQRVTPTPRNATGSEEQLTLRDGSRAAMHTRWITSAVNLCHLGWASRAPEGCSTRMAGACLLVGLPVTAAKIWWSGPAAICVFVVTLTAYVTFANRYVGRHGQSRDAVTPRPGSRARTDATPARATRDRARNCSFSVASAFTVPDHSSLTSASATIQHSDGAGAALRFATSRGVAAGCCLLRMR